MNEDMNQFVELVDNGVSAIRPQFSQLYGRLVKRCSWSLGRVTYSGIKRMRMEIEQKNVIGYPGVLGHHLKLETVNF